MAFDLARDEVGLKQALLDLFEESLAWSRLQSSLEKGDERSRESKLRSLPERKLSPGFYRLGEYLLWLERRIQAAGPLLRLCGGESIAGFEAEGLCVLSQARNEFERKHPPCGRCGELQDGRFVLMCWSCGLEFKR
ncbi:MAG: hypothetical protein WCC87_10350 [Candidatus Korobacteraceae bacterium]